MNIFRSENVVIDSEKYTRKYLIDYRYHSDKTAKPVVLFVHGFKGFKDWGAFNLMADYFAEQGFVFVKMNFSHDGTTIERPFDFADLEAFGNNNFTKELDDMDQVIDLICSGELLPSEEADMDKLYLMGHSRGGAVSIIKANEDHRIKKLGTLAALNDLSARYVPETLEEWKSKGVVHIHNARTHQDMPMYYQIVEDYYSNEQRLSIENAVQSMNIPFVATHGTNDETLPVAMLHQLKKWNDDVEIHQLQGAGHTFGSTHPYTSNRLPDDLKLALDHIINCFKK